MPPQELMEVGSAEDRRAIMGAMRNHVLQLARGKFGGYVVQKAITVRAQKCASDSSAPWRPGLPHCSPTPHQLP